MTQKIPNNFCSLGKEFSTLEKSRIAILPVAFGKTATWIKGTEKGPKAIIEASPNMEFYDIETDSEVCEKGIFTAKEITAKTPEEIVQKTYFATKELLERGKFVVTIGGEHTVSIGTIKAHAEKFSDLGILHLDAHLDSRENYLGSKFNHACTMARVKEITGNIVSVGIRSMDADEKEKIKDSKIFFAHKMKKSAEWQKEALEQLPQNVYITIDLDFFDTSIMPSVGTPEPGGFQWDETVEFLRKTIREKNVIGFDIVELCPQKSNKAPDFLAAKLIFCMLSEKFKNEK